MDRPKIKLSLTTGDYIMEILGLVFVLLMIGLSLYHYGDLPEEIPTHYGADGSPDRYGSRNMIWTLPGIGLLIYVALYILSRNPRVHNYTTRITRANAQEQYRASSRLVRILNTVITGVFCFLTYTTIQTALGKQSGLPSLFLPIFVLGMFVLLFVTLYRQTRPSKRS